MKALTLRAEWAFAVHSLDKRVENRGWAIPVGWYALHAGRAPGGKPTLEAACDADVAIRFAAARAGWFVSVTSGSIETSRVTFRKTGWHSVNWNVLETPTSAIRGVFHIGGADQPGAGDLDGWRDPLAVGNRIDAYRPLATPIPCRGAQGLWTVPDDIAAQLLPLCEA